MNVPAVTIKREPFSHSIRRIGRSVLAGLVCGLVSLAFALSFAALIFTGSLGPWLAYGIAASFITSAVAALVVALGSTLPFSIAGPDSSTSAVTAALVGSLTQHLAAIGASDRLLVATLILMPMSSALTGLLLYAIGFARGGRAVRFVPYPVIGGFLGATGLLVLLGAFHVVIGQSVAFSHVSGLQLPVSAMKLAAALGVGAALLIGSWRTTSPAVIPGVLILAVAAAYAIMSAKSIPFADASAAGWMFQIGSGSVLELPWDLDELNLFPWEHLPLLAGDLIAVMFVTAISTLLNVTGIEYATHQEADLNRELKTLGLANLCSAALGGYASCISLSRTLLNYNMGATARLSGVLVALTCGLVLLLDPALLTYVPKFVLGGLLLYLGATLTYKWLVTSAVRLSIIEYLSLLAIAFIIVKWGFIAGVLSGVVIGCATFALSASRISAIKYSFDGSEMRSSLDRSPEELALLANSGDQIQVVALHSYLFFGSANQLYEYVKALLSTESMCRFLIFDFRLVNGIDSSATHSFTQIKRLADEHRTLLVFVHLTPDLAKAFRAARFLTADTMQMDDLDQALEHCEEAIISNAQYARSQTKLLSDWLASALGREHAESIVRRCARVDLVPGEILARAGEPADAMHFILDGRLSILVGAGEHQVRVRSLGSHTTVGEMGLITGKPRNATVRADTPSVLYALSITEYASLKAETPAAALALLSYIVSLMSERLTFANRVVSVLRR